jgi:hypothetical protein
MSDKDIRRARAVIYEERWFCKYCGGDMEYVPSPLLGFLRTRHLHRCNTCGNTDRADVVYPRVIYEEESAAVPQQAMGHSDAS